MVDYLNRIVIESFKLPDNVILKNLDIDEQGRFWISDKGDIISVCRAQVIYKTFIDNGTGYYQTKIDGKQYYLHRLLAFSFSLDNEKVQNKDLYEVHHLDRDKKHNELNNLVIVSREKHRAIHSIWDKLDNCKVIEWEKLEI